MTERTSVGTVEDLHASATRMTGLDDFGTDDYTEALGVLLDSYARDEDLTPFGSKISRVFLRGALVARLLSEAAWKQFPEHADVQSNDRSSSPACRAPAPRRCTACSPWTRDTRGWRLWLTEMPQPRPPRTPGNPTRCSRRSSSSSASITSTTPSSWVCTTCRRARSRSAGSCCGRPSSRVVRVPGEPADLLDVARGADWTNAYARHKKNLQLIGLPDQDRRWVLKNPSHLFALDELMAVYPDALVIQTHPPAADHRAFGVQPGRAGHRGLVEQVPWRGDRPQPARPVGPRARGLHRRAREVDPASRRP